MNNLIILATYWNESYWIKSSLEQIKKISPVEVIICDGCFDPNIPNYSTDGTRLVIEEFVNENKNARMISALRPNYFLGLLMLLRGHKHLPLWTILRFSRWKFFIKSIFMSSYRRNQAITFNHMISVSKKWHTKRWFMNYDADQFYSDEMIKKIKEIVNQEENRHGLIRGKEITFFNDFNQFTDLYEKRTYNNMPHKIYEDTIIQPTRGIMREALSSKRKLFKNFWSKHLYIYNVPSVNIGYYFHYKINSSKRYKAGYRLGDRKEPEVEWKKMKNFKGVHPDIVKKNFNL